MAACVIRWNRANWGDRGTPVSQHPQTGTPMSPQCPSTPVSSAGTGRTGGTEGIQRGAPQCHANVPASPNKDPHVHVLWSPGIQSPQNSSKNLGAPPSNTPPGDPVTFRAIQVSLWGRERGLGGVWGAREVPRRGPQGFQVPPTPQYLLVLAVTALDDGGRQLLLLLQPPALRAATGIGGVNGAGEAPEGPQGVLGCREQGIHTRYLRKAPWTRRAAS